MKPMIFLLLAVFGLSASAQIYETSNLRKGDATITQVPEWAASTAYLEGQTVIRSGVLYRRLTAGTSGASFSSGNWLNLSSADTRDDLSELMERESAASAGTGSHSRETPDTGDSFVHQFTDTSSSAVTEFTPPLTGLSAASGNVWAIHATVEAATVANHVVSFGYEDSTNEATAQIQIGTSAPGTVVGTTSTGGCTVSSTFVHEPEAIGGTTVLRVTVLITWSDASSTDPHIVIQPVFNLDGTGTADVSSTGTAVIRKVEFGSQLEFMHVFSTAAKTRSEAYVDGKLVKEKVWSLSGLSDGSELLAAGSSANVVAFGGELTDASDRGYPIPYAYGTDSVCLFRTAAGAVQIKASGNCYPDATDGGYVWIRYTE